MHDWKHRVRQAFITSVIDDDIVEELAQHAEAAYEALRADDVPGPEALRQIDALIAGWHEDPQVLRRRPKRAPTVAPPSSSSRSAFGAMEDISYGLRLLRSQPGYALLTVLTIALGIGTTTTLFSVANSVLLRPLPWADSDALVRVTETRGGRQGRIPSTILNGTFLAWSEAPQTIESIGAWRDDSSMTLSGDGEATRVSVTLVTPGMFPTLKAAPVLGRNFAPDEGKPGQPALVILSFGFWQQRFGGRDDILGRTIVLDGSPATVVGVMPRDFQFPSREVRAWMPWVIPSVDGANGTKRGVIMRALARMRPGVTAAQVSAEGTARALAAPDAGPMAMALFGARDPIQVAAVDAKAAATAEVRPAILILLAAAGLLFVTAIANVANLQLARTAARHREFTIRAALGAGTSRLARQLLLENVIVGAIGGGAGLLLAATLHAMLPSILPQGFPRADAIAIDRIVLLFSVVLAGMTSVLCGVLPLMQVRRLDLARSLSEGGISSVGAGRGRVAATRAVIVLSQVAVTCVLLVGATLLVRSFIAYMQADRGYDPANVLTGTIPFPPAYPLERRAQALAAILERIKSRPGVTHAATSTALPLASAGGFVTFKFPSPFRPGAEIEVEAIRRVVTPDYFGALGIRVVAGRPLTAADGASSSPSVVVNRSFVRKYLDDVPVERAVSQSLGVNAVRSSRAPTATQIVGVVEDVKQSGPDEPAQPEMFVSYAQLPGANFGFQSFIVVRTADDPSAYVETLRTILRQEDPLLALDAVMTMDQRVAASLSRPRIYAVLLGGFALFALLIAGTGLFGVLSQSVTQRSREIAVRTALGATRGDVVRTVLAQAALAMIAGMAFGLASAFALSTTIAQFVYGVSTHDWVSFVAGPILLLVAGSLACIVPARRVANTDPLQVLREAR
ncbi:MAG: ABC transporter permease [Acidobacteriota bacterium]|nr:ABC transporter permease [Acidobacteriota bacterium]